MRLLTLMVAVVMVISCGNAGPQESLADTGHAPAIVEPVTVGYDMAEAGVGWLELVASGADDAAIREAFFRDVAPTAGCQAIIHHWERFRDWDEEILYDFILEALERKPSDKPLVGEDGQPTVAGHSRRLWLNAVDDVDQLRRNLEALQAVDVRAVALAKARRYLPVEADVSNQFHIVLFGASGAFSVGEENGFDLLQLKLLPDGTIDVEWVIDIFAHEMHHSGFSSAMAQHLGAAGDDDRIMLPGVLVAEGMATYYTTPPFPKLEAWRASDDPVDQGLAADWDSHLANMPAIYVQAELDIALGLEGGLTTDDLMKRWLGGMQGPAYGLGVDMIRLIDTELGTDAAINLARDSRQLLKTYNRAARKVRDDGREAYLFEAALADRLAEFELRAEDEG